MPRRRVTSTSVRQSQPLNCSDLACGQTRRGPSCRSLPEAATRYHARLHAEGPAGLDIILRTSTVPVNFSSSSEADIVDRVGLARPVRRGTSRQLSPFTEGRRFKSFRPASRNQPGPLPFRVRGGFQDTSATSTMRSMCRSTSSTETAGTSMLRARGKLQREAVPPTEPHLRPPFTEVRLKSFLNAGADGGRWSRICELSPAL